MVKYSKTKTARRWTLKKKETLIVSDLDRERICAAVTLLSRSQHQIRLELKKFQYKRLTENDQKKVSNLRGQLMRNRLGMTGLRHYNNLLKSRHHS